MTSGGYVVLERQSGSLMVLGDENVLWVPSGHVPWATVFPDLRAARYAIRRTRRYAERHGYQWPDDYRVFKLKAR